MSLLFPQNKCDDIQTKNYLLIVLKIQLISIINATFWRFSTIFEIDKKGSKKYSQALKRVFSLGLNFIGRVILGKIDCEKRPQNGHFLPKSKGINLNFLTTLDH